MSSARLCLHDLEALSNETSSEKRRVLLRRITDLFMVTNERQGDDDREVFGSVMERVAYDLEVEARAELSERLAHIANAPHNVVVRLAGDEIEVAGPVLAHSAVLTDQDLVTIAEQQGQEHMLAMSGREELSSMVTDVLVNRGEAAVLNKVAANDGANFSAAGFDMLTMRAIDNEQLRSALVARSDMPNSALEKIKQQVAEKLKSEMSQTHPGVSAKEIEAVVNAKAANVDLDELSDKDTVNDVSLEDIDHLYHIGELGETRVAKYAADHRVPEAIRATGLLAKLDDNMVRYCLFEAEVPALGVLCKATGFSRGTFAGLLQLRVQKKKMPTHLVVKALKRYDSLTLDTAQRIMRFLKVRLATATGGSG